MRLPFILFIAAVAVAQTIEQRGHSLWPNANHYRVRYEGDARIGMPVAVSLKLPDRFNPDSVRIVPATPVKVEWRRPNARVSFVATGERVHHIYFDTDLNGETKRLPEPFAIGTGDRMTYGRSGVRGRAAVGLWPHPSGFDTDDDGDTDLVVGCSDRPSNGTYLFRNVGSNDKPLYDRPEWLGPGPKELTAGDMNGDGAIDIVVSGGYYSDFKRNRLSNFVPVKLERSYWIGRDDMWSPADWDRDGRIDLLVGVSDWREYGWDDAYNERGEWTRGPLHGYVYFHRNIGTNSAPKYAAPLRLDGIDVYGSPAPTAVDWFGKGILDLLTGSFMDTVHVFAGGRGPAHTVARMDLCMIQPRVVQWHADGRSSLLVAEEDGTIALFENTAPRGKTPSLGKARYLEQIDPYLKSGALSRPVAADWNGDGKLDLIAGNSAGYIQYFENVGTRTQPAFEDRGYLAAAGKTIRRTAGPNGSVQGPAEAKWGYSNPSVADWDLDGDPDLLVNDIWGDVVWYRNDGTKSAPRLAAMQSIEVEWPGKPPKPDWVWWEPKPRQLVTQWRTTPKVIDWDRDGLPDLAMLNHQGYLSLFRRARVKGALVLFPPERIFVEPGGRFLNLSAGRAGRSGRRKIEFADLDRDGDMELITDSDDGPVWYDNIGSQQKPAMQLKGTLVKAKLPGHNPTPNLADWNGDGKLDLIVGAEDGFFYYFDGRYMEAGN